MKLPKLLIVFSITFCLSCFSYAGNYQFNARISPLGFLSGTLNGGLDYILNQHWTIGGDLSYTSVSANNAEASGIGLGVRAQYFFDKAFSDNWYIAPFALFINIDGKNTITAATASARGTILGVFLGYMWIWQNFNTQVGFGLQKTSLTTASDSTVDFNSLSTTSVALEFNLGWAF